MTYSLFDQEELTHPWNEALLPGAILLHRHAQHQAEALSAAIAHITAQAPWRQMHTPGGRRIQVHNSSCGSYGWVSDARGYRYENFDPLTGQAWPTMPPLFLELAAAAAAAAGYPDFVPDSCLINRYLRDTSLSLHQDKDEADFQAPIVSISLGMSANFVFGGLTRDAKLSRLLLEHGDVLVWGGAARLLYHGVQSLCGSADPLLGEQRINLTFRKAK
ncbi:MULTISPECIES: DNA oxidative demethylase AlkB [unclassified Undibacterium]|uniref:DNA oxidative demethylase AlkB n=1 Tax=unclassified Undibacterium TaxID=2630295 RepID=UPI002AC8AA30|nr:MULTISPECIES: DNA oxidative demethylase AlkB [unclassified Undibacterium]MEB0138201.1 DNA oxidative demethylase AlkB [Undibacterium sp. CCC2.1]MEB0171044.1 DNA oxidative demethylase AlkB [Undibacterium sp. CCC1.1]MEB0175089.1 DNA oxidative demethylase AlkB [Undibacterium sp. CCC3.4]MEB0214327.1 DNA oxidative demethylase AlkB [Undibacterium sp. 5I2]WPX41908.1 DNA oxidative demethylase AlkB [Undibacterium sp. CCC3.4]